MYVGASSRISYMAEDHFTTNMWKPNEVDWHFLIRLNNQTQLRDMVKRYAKIYDHPGLYPPIPFEWLHMTILRIGNVANITDQEMNDVLEQLFPALEMLHVPELLLGPWWLWTGSVVLHVTPEEPITHLFNAVTKVLSAVVGEKAPKPDGFIPHVTFVVRPSTWTGRLIKYDGSKGRKRTWRPSGSDAPSAPSAKRVWCWRS
jgi:2'-5' RNA ligase